MIPKILKNFNLFVDSIGYAGKLEEVTLPTLTMKMSEISAAGMDAPMDVAMGMEKLTCSFTLSEYDMDAMSHFGLEENAHVPLTIRGALQDSDGVTPIVINMTGIWKELEFGSWKAGDKSTLKVSVVLHYYKLTINDEEMVEVDVINMVRKVKGVDQLADMRGAMGL